MTVKKALEWAGRVLKEQNIETPVKESGVLLAFVLSKELSWLYAHPEYILSPKQAERFTSAVRLRSDGMPFQYISNKQEFMSLNFYVDSNCLIPRPDTEILVESALSWLKLHSRGVHRVLDIGTGCGAIAISIARYCEKTMVEAIDLSDGALEIAKKNALYHGVHNRIQFFKADFIHWEAQTPYSVVLSNPPYIPSAALNDLMPGVREYEPLMALDGGEDGLMFYRAIAEKLKRLLYPEGALFVEVGRGQAGHVRGLFDNKGLKTTVYKDLAGIDRVVCVEMSGKNS